MLHPDPPFIAPIYIYIRLIPLLLVQSFLSDERPGVLGRDLTRAFKKANYDLITTSNSAAKTPGLTEVYPHPALLSLLKLPKRLPYKVSKSTDYWPKLAKEKRITNLVEQFAKIYSGLTQVLGPLGFNLPDANQVKALTHLKHYEDALDALICAWVGIEYLSGRTVPLGDETAAIWCPSDVVLSRSW